VLQNRHDDQEPDQLSEVVAIPAKELAPEGPTEDPSVIVSAGDRKHLRARATSGARMAQGKDFLSKSTSPVSSETARRATSRSGMITTGTTRSSADDPTAPAPLSSSLVSLGDELPSQVPGEESPPDP
jgi:hypothetical protein